MRRTGRHRWIFLAYAGASLALFLYSYTQIDLNLTLSRLSYVSTIERFFQHIGYYQRQLSTLLYVGIVGAFFVLYGRVLSLVSQDVLKLSHIWRLIWIAVVVLACSYPAAFSYDFFNYLFTAKTVLVYHQNPYLVTPLHFSGLDPWTNFMRWTHLTTAYAPLWIGLTLVPYILGFGYFVPVLFATKIMIAGFYLLSMWVIVRIMKELDAKRAALSLAIVALNPLVLIESLVSGHNDIVLVAFTMLSIWFFVRKNAWQAWLYLSFSIAAKLVTVSLIPVMLMKKRREWLLIAMIFSLVVVLFRREFLPWYWVWIMPFIALFPDRMAFVRSAGIVSLGLVLSYAPYLYFGEYSAIEQAWKAGIVWSGVGAGALMLVLDRLGMATGKGVGKRSGFAR